MSTNSELPENKVLLIANPKSGNGSQRNLSKAIKMLKQVLSEANIKNVEVCETNAPHHATKLIIERAEKIHEYSAVLVVGGDGTLHEVVEGLVSIVLNMQPETYAGATTDEVITNDESTEKQLPPLAPIPMGTGNGIAVSMNLTSVKRAALNVMHGIQGQQSTPSCILQYYPLSNDGKSSPENTEANHKDMMKSSETKKKIYQFLIAGVQWGLPAQVDQGTEWMRFAGDARFTLGALAHIGSKRDYSARIVIEVDTEHQRKATEEINRLHKEFQVNKKGKKDKKKNTEFHLEDVSNDDDDVLCKQTGENEYTLDGRFVMMVAWNCQAIANDFIMTPLARLSQVNVFDIMLVPSRKLNRIQMIDFLLHSDGSFLASAPHLVKYFKAKRVKVERLEGDFLTVDGENVKVEPFVLEVAPQSGAIHMIDTMTSTT